MKEYYSRLFLKDGASIEEVKKAHRKLIKKFHPDKNEGDNEFTEEFKLIQEAYEKLISYLGQNRQSQNYNQKNHSNQSDEGIVKSDTKFAEAGDSGFAEAGDVVKDDMFYKIVISSLVILGIWFGIYAILEQQNSIIKITLLIFAIFCLIISTWSIVKKLTQKS